MRQKSGNNINCCRKDSNLDLGTNMNETHKITVRSLLAVRADAAWNMGRK